MSGVGIVRTQSLAHKRGLRPSLTPMLEASGKLLELWHADGFSGGLTGGLSGGFRFWNGQAAEPLSEAETANTFSRLNLVHQLQTAAERITQTIIAATMTAATSPVFCNELRALKVAGGVNFILERYLEQELKPGLFATAGLIQVACDLQEKPDLARLERIIWNTSTLLHDWTGLGEEGFAVVDEGCGAWMPEDIPKQKHNGQGYNAANFIIASPQQQSECLELSAPAIERICSLANSRVTNKSPYRIGCSGTKVRIGELTYIDYSVLWLLSLMKQSWSQLKF